MMSPKYGYILINTITRKLMNFATNQTNIQRILPQLILVGSYILYLHFHCVNLPNCILTVMVRVLSSVKGKGYVTSLSTKDTIFQPRENNCR